MPCAALGRLAGALVVAATALSWGAEHAMANADDGALSDLPAGAIEVGEGRYQVPLGPDEDGCMMYQLHVPGLMVPQVISYRRADGSFTNDKREAACDRDAPGR